MINTSTAYQQAQEKDRRFVGKASCLLKNGTMLDFDKTNLMASGIKISDGVSGSNSFDIGSAIVNKLTVMIYNGEDAYSDYDFDKAVITIWIGQQLSNHIEWLKKGVFNASDPTTTPDVITLEALDNMSKFDVVYDGNLTFPATLQTIVQYCCGRCGVTMISGQFPNYNYQVNKNPFDDNSNITYRAILAYCAQIAGCYARCNADGNLELKWYDTAAFDDIIDGGVFDATGESSYQTGDELDGGNFTDYSSGDSADGGTFTDPLPYHHIYSLVSLSVSTEDVVITGIRVTAADSENAEGKKLEGETYLCGVEGYVLHIKGNPLIEYGKAQEVAEYLGGRIIGMRFRPFTASCLGDPSMEAGDAAVVTDRKGNSYYTYLTNISYSTGNYASISCDAEPAARHSADRYSELDKIIAEIKKDSQFRLSEYAQYVDKLNTLAINAMGYYETTETQDDGSMIKYMHDKPLLSESTIIYKNSIDGFFWSKDGGDTWTAGIDKDGNAVMNVIAAIGINADWINTGVFTVQDDEGNVIFLANVDTGQVIIDAQSLRVGGKPVATEEQLRDASNLQVVLSSEYHGIPTDEEGNNGNYADCYTDVSILFGATDVTDSASITINESQDVQGSWNAEECRYTVTDLLSDNGYVDFTVSYYNLTVVKRFALAKNKQGERGDSGRIYFIEPSFNVLKRSANNSISPNFVEFRSYYRDGNSATRYAYSGRFIIEETIDGDTWTTIYTSTENENSVKHYLYSMLSDASGAAVATANGDTIGIPRDVVQVRCKLYAAGGTTDLMDMQSVTVVTDVDALTHEEIFDLLTNNGEIKGIYKEGNQLYISFTYAKGGALTLGGSSNTHGVLKILNADGELIGKWDKDGIDAIKGNFSGSLSSATGTFIDGILTNATIRGGTLKLENSSIGEVAIDNAGVKVGIDHIVIMHEDGTAAPYASRLWSGSDGSGYVRTYANSGTSHYAGFNGENMRATGSKNRIVKTDDYGKLLQYCYEMPSPMFGDMGTGVVDRAGVVYISIDDRFAQTIAQGMEYYVFLQKEGDGDIWVGEKASTYFVVRGTPGISFSWEMKAIQRDYQFERLDVLDFVEGNEIVDVNYAVEAAQMVEQYYTELEEVYHEEIN